MCAFSWLRFCLRLSFSMHLQRDTARPHAPFDMAHLTKHFGNSQRADKALNPPVRLDKLAMELESFFEAAGFAAWADAQMLPDVDEGASFSRPGRHTFDVQEGDANNLARRMTKKYRPEEEEKRGLMYSAMRPAPKQQKKKRPRTSYGGCAVSAACQYVPVQSPYSLSRLLPSLLLAYSTVVVAKSVYRRADACRACCKGCACKRFKPGPPMHVHLLLTLVSRCASCRLACLVLWWQDPIIMPSTYKSHVPGLIAYQTREVVRLEPHKYECGISMLCWGYGMSAELLGIKVEDFPACWPPNRVRFSTLNNILQQSTGAGRALELQTTDLSVKEAFTEDAGCIIGMHCRFVNVDNRGAPLDEWDFDSNYEHCESSLALGTLTPPCLVSVCAFASLCCLQMLSGTSRRRSSLPTRR
jgi:hypothetical protein